MATQRMLWPRRQQPLHLGPKRIRQPPSRTRRSFALSSPRLAIPNRWQLGGHSPTGIGSKPYRGVFLTEAGQALAGRARARHRVVVDLLIAVGVPQAVAEADAEGIEHHVSDAALEAFERFLGRRPCA